MPIVVFTMDRSRCSRCADLAVHVGPIWAFSMDRNPQDDQAVERIGSPYDCPMVPKPTHREGGTLQKASFVMRRPAERYGETYYLVVRCQREWLPEGQAPQTYAVVVSVEHTEQVDLYARIEARVRLPLRVRA